MWENLVQQLLGVAHLKLYYVVVWGFFGFFFVNYLYSYVASLKVKASVEKLEPGF